ncbi:MAG: glycosyltransferase [Dehalococcoidia bacterium]|nr:MAG: glycosyltransferase [Dehalococcoidia bacterium]
MLLQQLVSIVTPAYNAERYIEDTLKSIKCQTYPNLEHIVIDDGSTDKTASLLKKYEELYNLNWFSKANEGQAITVNQAFKLAKGDLIIWLNSDDVLFSIDVIKDVVETFKRRTVDVVYGHMAIIDAQNMILKIQYAPPKLNFDILQLGHFAACVFYRRNIVSEYPLEQTYNYALDYEQCLRMAKNRIKFGFINKPLLAWRKHCHTKTISGNSNVQVERNALRKKFNIEPGFKHYWMKLFYYGLLMVIKAYGINEVLKLNRHPEDFHLAFCPHFDQLFKLAKRQVIPYM